MIGILLTAVTLRAEPIQQSLIYDLMIVGEPVGHRKVTITYIPPTGDSLDGAREIESFTDIQMTVAGKDIVYRQQATGYFSDSGSKFVSVVSINDESFEIQGKQRSNNVWTINQILPSGIHRQQFSPNELTDISLALFDPGQAMQWRTGQQSIYEVETGSVWTGDWSSLGEHSITNQDTAVYGRKMRFHGHRGDWTGTWSTEGLLIDWSLTVIGVTVDATLRSIPDLPQFGEIELETSFGGVQEEEL
jgi:hypothetical protein